MRTITIARKPGSDRPKIIQTDDNNSALFYAANDSNVLLLSVDVF